MVFHWSLSDSKSPQVSRTLLGILADLNNTVFWMVSTHQLISKSSSLYTNPLVIVSSAQIISGITVTLIFHSFFSSLAKFRYLSLFSISVVSRNSKVCYLGGSLFIFFLFCFGHLAKIRWPVCISKVCVCLSAGRILICANTICSYGQIKILAQFPVDQAPPTQLCQDLDSFCANLLHLLIIWLIVSPLSQHNLHWLFCCPLFLFLFWHTQCLQ